MLLILITLVGILAVWMRVYKSYKQCYSISYIRDWWHDATITKATLQQFKDIYYISPNKFVTNYRFPYYGKKYQDNIVIFQFPFIDWLKYLIWRKNIEKEKQREEEASQSRQRQEKDNETLKRMYESLLSDIEKTRKQGEEYVEEARNITTECMNLYFLI